MTDEKSAEVAAEPTTKVEPQTVAPTPAKAPKAKAPKAKKPAKKTAQKTKAPAKTKDKAKVTKKTAKQPRAKAAKLTNKKGKSKAIPQGKFPRNKANPFREGSAYGAIFDAMARKEAGIRRDELTKLAMEATGKDAKHAAYDLAVILSAKDTPTGNRHPSCREGFFCERENDFIRLVID